MNGEGVAKENGKILLVEHALVGETVDTQIYEDNKTYALAKVKDIISSSPNRTTPVCPYFFICGGCDLQHMKYEEQLKFKSELVKKTLKKVADIEIEPDSTVASDKIFNYRNKVSFNVGNLVGFYKKNSKDIVEVEDCKIASDSANKILFLFNQFIKDSKNKSLIKNLVVREIQNQILVGVVAKSNKDLSTFYQLLNSNFEKIGLYLIINTRNDSVVLSGKVLHVDGIKYIKISSFGLTYSVDLIGFHQTNQFIQDKIYNKVLEYLTPSSFVINGFSGQGLLSAILAKKAKKVVGIEINTSSHKTAELLKKSNNIHNLTNICGDFFKEYSKIKDIADFLVLDPSKKGCGVHIMKKVIGIKNIIYISCNPIALAKDLREIKDYYEIEQVIPFDMFPNTKNVETLVKLKLKENYDT